MGFVIRCVCGQRMTVESSHVGREVLCVRCRQKLVVPNEPSDPESEPMAAVVGAGAQAGPGPEQPEGVRARPPAVPPVGSSGDWSYGQGPLKPHRGGTILALGIASIVLSVTCCCSGLIAAVPGVAALALGIPDLKEMGRGRMDPSGQSMTLAGTICGGIGILLALSAIGVGALWMKQMPWRGHQGIWRGI